MEATNRDVARRYAKYVFLDVVQFSRRSAEAQSDIVQHLNGIVHQSLETHGVSGDACILIPTGDGMCIGLVSPDLPYDTHIQVALNILGLLDGHNKAASNESRQFQVRIGINQNTDILVTDINERKNIAGAGINMASRIMDKADGGQILVSQTVYDELQPSEHYMDKFKSFDALGKHNLKFRVYQFVSGGYPGLNCETPNEFVKKQACEVRLSKTAAFYFAHAIRQKQFILKKQGHGQENYSLVVLLWFLATDSKGESEATEVSPYSPCIYGDGKLDLDAVLGYYNSVNFRTVCTLANFILNELAEYGKCLTSSGFGYELLFVKEEGKQKLKKEWPEIWKEFELDRLA